jgi:GntR family transcriptional regulator, rspAB operon transcriptional repressor
MEVWFTIPGSGRRRRRVTPDEIDQSAAVAPQIYHSIRARIVAGALEPGALLSEAEVAAAYRVSRQPVREAFIRLAAVGLVQVRPQRGTYVTAITEKAVLDARFVREAIEAEIVRLVAAEPDPAVLADLRAQLTLQRAIAPGDAPGFLRLDERFHRTLAEAADQPYAWGVIEEVKAQIDRVRLLSFFPQHMARLIEQHATIVEAIAAADAAAAERAMRAHLREIIQSVRDLASERPDLFTGTHTQKHHRRKVEDATL